MTTIQDTAAQLLKLEKTYRERPLSIAEESRWTELVMTWTKNRRRDDEMRHFLRYPAGTKAVFRAGDTRKELSIEEISRFGLKLRGDLGKQFRAGDDVVWESVESKGQWHTVGAPCEVVRKVGRWTAGLSIPTGDEAASRIFESVYYPAYLAALESDAAPQ